MTEASSDIHWVVQSNLIKPAVLNTICSALEADGTSYEQVYVIPFSDKVPELSASGSQLVFYGSSTLLMNAAHDTRYAAGVFYDKERFSMASYLRNWGIHLLNADARILCLSEIASLGYDSDSEWFIRPNGDDKSFSGAVMTFQEICHFAQEAEMSNNPYLQPDTRVVISQPRAISKEWRHFITGGEIISSSRYMLDGALNVSSNDVPATLLDFVLQACSVYTPHDIFVMDTALSDGRYAIIECNCFNGTGFYDHDISAIVRSVNQHLRKYSA